MSTKISALPAAIAGNITDATVLPLVDSTTTTVKASLAQVFTQLLGTSRIFASNLTVGGITIQVGALGTATGGALRCVTDDGLQRWLVGPLATAAARDFTITDLQGGVTRLTINSTTGLATLANGLTVTASGVTITAGGLSLVGAAAAGSAGVLVVGGTQQTTIGANGAASALTANPLGYIKAFVGATAVIIPYYNA